MFDLYLEDLRGGSGVRDFLADGLLVRVVFRRQSSQQLCRRRHVFHNVAPAEHDGTLHIRRPREILYGFVSVDCEAHLVAGFYRIELVTRARTVKADFFRGGVIEIIYRDRVRISVVSVDREDASAAFCRSASAASALISFLLLLIFLNMIILPLLKKNYSGFAFRHLVGVIPKRSPNIAENWTLFEKPHSLAISVQL